MFKEVEKKFLIDKLPDIDPKDVYDVYQGYIITDDNIEIRVRHSICKTLDGESNKDGSPIYESYKMTIKSGGLEVRDEVDFDITPLTYKKIVELFINRPMIYKKQYVFSEETDSTFDRIYECSVVDEGLATSFIYFEEELLDENELTNYKFPFENLGEVDVTNDGYYKMKNYWKRTRISGDIIYS